MPFQIIRNDITKVKADIIVNTANPKPTFDGGVDSAIYEAAGKEKLLAERKKIGDIAPGEAAITPAFSLNAKYIIHTVGPTWKDGKHSELETLKSCYEKSLDLALQNNCESIAFPLIATGVYGFPKDKALQVATSVIQEFLFEHEMSITLVVFDRKAFELSGKVYSDVQEYISENYVDLSMRCESMMRRSERRVDTLSAPEACTDESEMFAYSEESLDELLNSPAENFQEKLFSLIDNSGLDDVTVYKKANITKKVFSDIKTKKNYRPSKKTAVAFAIALELSLDETVDLLQRAGMALSPSSKFDLIVRYYISHGIYDMMEINLTLFKNQQECLGAIQ